ncbi:S24 family peptidase [Reyranella massiliensis]|uniref:S24 family peptidase n=1 Tax=Reyranella massiliensis TaxID=445220 RepID=UPI0015A5431D
MTLGDRVRDERVARGWSQKDLAARVTALRRQKTTQVAIHHIESRGNVMPRFVVELAQALEVNLDWLRLNKGPKKGKIERLPAPAERKSQQTPIRHYVGAGDEIHIINEDGPIDETDAPPGYGWETGGAAVVRGDSMRPYFDPGDILFFRHRRSPPASAKALPVRPVIVYTSSGALYVKKLLPGTKKGRFHLLSLNPLTPALQDQPVESFAYIEWVKPRAM